MIMLLRTVADVSMSGVVAMVVKRRIAVDGLLMIYDISIPELTPRQHCDPQQSLVSIANFPERANRDRRSDPCVTAR